MKSLYEIALTVEFSDSEKARISQTLVSAQGPAYRIFTTKAKDIKDPTFWSEAIRHFRLGGFRAESVRTRETIVAMAMRALKGQGSHKQFNVWPLYRSAVHQYLADEKKALGRLLSEVKFEEGASENYTTLQIFQEIKKNAGLFDVPNEDILEFYEIWGFERVEDAKRLVEEQPVHLATIQRLLKSSEESSKKYIDSRIDAILFGNEKAEEANNFRINSVESHVADLKSGIENSISILKIEIQNLTASIVTSKVAELSAQLKSAAAQQPMKPKAAEVSSEAIDKISERIDNLAGKISALESANVTNRVRAGASPEKSVPPAEMSADQAVDKWISYLKAINLDFKSKHSLVGILEIIRRSKVIITPDWGRLKKLFQLCSDISMRESAVSPLWISQKDWEDQYQFISASEDSRVLVLLNFDNAIQDAYLVPTLVEWIQGSASVKSKLILVPSSSSTANTSSSVLHFATRIRIDSDICQELASFLDESKNPSFAAGWLVGPTSAFCKFDSYKNASDESDLRRILQNEGIEPSEALLERFVNVKQGLSQMARESDATRIAFQLTLVPWLEREKGENASRLLEERLGVFFGAI